LYQGKKRVSVDDFSPPGNPHGTPVELVSPAAEVVLWWATLAASDEEVARVSGWLAPAEHARAARFGREALSRRYVLGRALLRWTLGNALSLPPSAVPIVRGVRGRPQLATDVGIDFNVSHTEGVALIGIARAGRIGVDVERADRDVRADGLARKFLTAAEQATLVPLPEAERRARFLRYWTCKEAMSKATGDGLSAPLRLLEVRLADAIELGWGPAPYEPARWRLHAVDVPDGYLATLALWSDPSFLRRRRSGDPSSPGP
jgi:4'-phosphopantetheinyl transferase